MLFFPTARGKHVVCGEDGTEGGDGTVVADFSHPLVAKMLLPLITVMALGLCASGAPIDLSQVTALNVDCNRAQPCATPGCRRQHDRAYSARSMTHRTHRATPRSRTAVVASPATTTPRRSWPRPWPTGTPRCPPWSGSTRSSSTRATRGGSRRRKKRGEKDDLVMTSKAASCSLS